MRTSTCKQCGGEIRENDTNPAVHYSNPPTICWRCEAFNEAPSGAWFQRPDGSYYQKD